MDNGKFRSMAEMGCQPSFGHRDRNFHNRFLLFIFFFPMDRFSSRCFCLVRFHDCCDNLVVGLRDLCVRIFLQVGFPRVSALHHLGIKGDSTQEGDIHCQGCLKPASGAKQVHRLAAVGTYKAAHVFYQSEEFHFNGSAEID